ncbi:hypothetical protein FOZ63_008331, partial [Perkinsus olseni]
MYEQPTYSHSESRRPSNRRPYQTAGSGQGRTDATSDGEATLAISSQQPGRDL